jgi:hypothetical protein
LDRSQDILVFQTTPATQLSFSVATTVTALDPRTMFGCLRFTENLGKKFIPVHPIRLPGIVIAEQRAYRIQKPKLFFLVELPQMAAC